MATREGQPRTRDTSWWICGSWRTRAPRCLEAERERFPEGHGPNGAETQGLDSLQVAGAGPKGLGRRPLWIWLHTTGLHGHTGGVSPPLALCSAEKSGVSWAPGQAFPRWSPTEELVCVRVCVCVCPSEGVSLVCVPLCMYL